MWHWTARLTVRAFSGYSANGSASQRPIIGLKIAQVEQSIHGVDRSLTRAGGAGSSVTAERQAALLAVLADVALNEAITAAAESLTGATEEQKANIRKANLRRLSAGLALATLAVDGGRLALDIGSLVQKITAADPPVLAELSVEAVKLWPQQIKQIAGNASAFGKASNATDKSVKEVHKKAQIDPPTQADIRADRTASGACYKARPRR